MKRIITCSCCACFVLLCISACDRRPETKQDGSKPPIVVANQNPPQVGKQWDPKVIPKPPKDKESVATKPDPPPEEDNEPWPDIVDEPPVEPKPLDAKVLEAWLAAGAKTGWQTSHQHFEKRPEFKYYPEMLPYLEMRPFKPGVISKLPPPGEPFSFYLYGSDITDAGVRELAGLKKLRKVNLVNNAKLTGAGFSELTRLPDLRILLLYQTKVDDAGLKEICRIKTLRELDIGVTLVTETGLAELPRLKRLQTLGVLNVKMTDAGLKHLARCRNLRELSMCRLAQSGAGLKALGGLPHLAKLAMAVVDGMELKAADVKGLGALQSLRSLNLSNNSQLSDAALPEIGALKKLSNLQLHKCNITAAGLKHLAGLQELEQLDLSANPITDAGIEHLAGLKNLKELQLGATKITEAGLKAIIAFPSDKLQTVKLPTTISKAAMAEAKKMRPKVSFGHY